MQELSIGAGARPSQRLRVPFLYLTKSSGVLEDRSQGHVGASATTARAMLNLCREQECSGSFRLARQKMLAHHTSRFLKDLACVIRLEKRLARSCNNGTLTSRRPQR